VLNLIVQMKNSAVQKQRVLDKSDKKAIVLGIDIGIQGIGIYLCMVSLFRELHAAMGAFHV